MTEFLTIALPKGRLANQVLTLLEETGYPLIVDPSSRVLIQEDVINQFAYMFVKPSDVITYVEEGVCDIGFVGSDSIIENNPEVYDLFDLQIGRCKMVIAGKDSTILDTKSSIKVASKYPNTAKFYLDQENLKSEIVKLNGSVELGPLVGLSDVIVDIYETGSTLRANNLSVLKELFEISTRLIANKASYRMKRLQIEAIITRLEQGDK